MKERECIGLENIRRASRPRKFGSCPSPLKGLYRRKRPSIIRSMKRVLFVLFIFLLLSPLHAEERKTAKDFAPPPPDEKAVLEALPQLKNPAVGFWIGTGTTVGGTVLSGVALGYTVKSALDRDIPSVNRGIVLTGTGMVLSAISAVVTDFLLDEWTKKRSEKREATSAE